MKRLRTILLFLLLGALVNVAVAWGLALTIEATRGPELARNPGWGATYQGFGTEYGMMVRAWAGPGTICYYSVRSPRMINQIPSYYSDPDEMLPRWFTLSPPDFLGFHPFDNQIVIAYGWPMRTLWSRHQFQQPGIIDSWSGIRTPIFETTYQGDSSPIPMPASLPRLLPVRPIWSGFAINMLVFGMLPWMLFPGRFAVLAYLRRNRGLCLKCAYDLKGAEHEVCPECGSALVCNRTTGDDVTQTSSGIRS